jgi:hypothetical protein
LEKKIVIEVDGGQHSTQMQYDEERSAWLATQGFRVLRFWNNEVLGEIEMVKEVIWKTLTQSHPLLDPPSSRERKKTQIPSPLAGEGQDGGTKKIINIL